MAVILILAEDELCQRSSPLLSSSYKSKWFIGTGDVRISGSFLHKASNIDSACLVLSTLCSIGRTLCSVFEWYSLLPADPFISSRVLALNYSVLVAARQDLDTLAWNPDVTVPLSQGQWGTTRKDITVPLKLFHTSPDMYISAQTLPLTIINSPFRHLTSIFPSVIFNRDQSNGSNQKTNRAQHMISALLVVPVMFLAFMLFMALVAMNKLGMEARGRRCDAIIHNASCGVEL